MDFFTHLMIGFLISSWISGSFFHGAYMALGTLMAGISDFDILLYPLWKRFPILGHHGLTHMLAFILISALIIFSAYTAFSGTFDPMLLLVMVLAGSSHILGDFLTNWGVPPFYPLTRRYYKINLDVAVNPLVLAYFFIGCSFLYLVSQGYVSMSPKGASETLGATYLAYLIFRAVFKLYYLKKPENKGFSALPTLLPWRWRLVRRAETDEAILITLRRSQENTCIIPKGAPEYPEYILDRIKSCEDLVYTYWLPEVQEFMRVFEYPYYDIDCSDEKREISWHSAEMGDDMNVVVRIDDCGVDVKATFPSRRDRRARSQWP